MNSLTMSSMWFRYCMPYVLQKIEHPGHKHVWLPLNRRYKLLGQTDMAWVEYAEHADQAMVFRRDPRGFKEIWRVCSPDMVSLYDDWPESRRDYFERLGKLMPKAYMVSQVSAGYPRAVAGLVAYAPEVRLRSPKLELGGEV